MTTARPGGDNTGVWHPTWTRQDAWYTGAVLYTAQINPFDPLSQLVTFVKPFWRAPVPSQSCRALRSRGQSSRSQENRKSLLSAGGWAATQSHHLCLSSAVSSLPLHTSFFTISFTTSFHLLCRNIYRVQVRKQKLQLHPHHHRIYLQLGLCGAAR